ncbi:MAG: DUF481 domain-containing protein [Gammaproteobacteria bacterium]|nr:DUF481 domain-containing protein [Gammaproteobacteria bacterium]MBQ0838246.1 DUF481 domain-containing protein [Gammaproteobacteria bacterium]
MDFPSMHKTHIALALAASLLASLPAIADELIMKDGSRLIGEVVKQDGGSTFDFKTSYAGVIKVKWSQTSELHTDKAITVLLENGETRQINSAKSTETGIATATESGTIESFTLAEVAYVNPEPWRLGEGWNWTGNTNALLNYERGNSEKDEYGADIAMTFRRLHDRVKLNADYDREKNNDILTDENWRINSRYDHFVDKQLFYGATLGLEHDRFADLRLRTTVGPLIGYEFYESKAMNLDVAAGPIWVNEEFYDGDNRDYIAFGWIVDFDRYLIPGVMQFYHRHTGLLEADDTDNLVWDAWTGLRFPIYAGIVASTEVLIEYDGGAQNDVDHTDTTYSIKLGYEW